MPSQDRQMQTEERKYFHHDRIGQCEMCGKIAPCEVHHRKPLSLGGTNDIDNLIYVCCDCHKAAHRNNRTDMIKEGMRNENNKEYVVGFYELYAKIIHLVVDSNGHAKAYEVLDILDELPIRKNARKNKKESIEEYKKSIDIFNEWLESE